MIRLEQSFVDEIIAHAREDAPNECCGLIGGVDGRATKLYRAANAAESPASRYRYEVDSKDLLRISRAIQDHDWDVFAIYHSHTGTEARPSPTDVRLAFYPDAFYLIVSLMDPTNPVMRAFRIVDGEVEEEDLEVV